MNLDEIKSKLKPFTYRGKEYLGGGIGAWSFRKQAKYNRCRAEFAKLLEAGDEGGQEANLIEQLALLVPGWSAEDMGAEGDEDAMNLPKLSALLKYLMEDDEPKNATAEAEVISASAG
jgi:hypothetical protein